MFGKFMSKIQKRFMNPMISMMDRWENNAVSKPASHKALPDAPVRFEIMKEGMKRGGREFEPEIAHIMPPTMLGMRESMLSIDKNPAHPKTEIPVGFIRELEVYAKSQGVSSIGYTKVPEKWIFKNQAIMHLNAIMLTMEMDKVRIDTAPSILCEAAVIEIYRDLGIAANKIATWLRIHGNSAEAGHPLMGPTLYPPLVQMAGLGQLSASGLVITPEHGPRVRLAAVFTNIEDLPFSTHNEHAWVADFCKACGICIRECPAQAIHETPVAQGNGRFSCVDNTKCFPRFSDYHGCSVCIKVCPFNNTPYDKIRHNFRKKDA